MCISASPNRDALFLCPDFIGGKKIPIRKRNNRVVVHLNDAELSKLEQDTATAGMCREKYIRLALMPAFADDPLTTINNLSNFVFSAIKAIGAILLGFGIVQIGLALKGHDASQRAQGFMTFFGGVVIYFAKDILDMIR